MNPLRREEDRAWLLGPSRRSAQAATLARPRREAPAGRPADLRRAPGRTPQRVTPSGSSGSAAAATRLLALVHVAIDAGGTLTIDDDDLSVECR